MQNAQVKKGTELSNRQDFYAAIINNGYCNWIAKNGGNWDYNIGASMLEATQGSLKN